MTTNCCERDYEHYHDDQGADERYEARSLIEDTYGEDLFFRRQDDEA